MELVTVRDKVFRKYISREKIDRAVGEIASGINKDYADKKPLLLAVLNGAFVFAADLMRNLTIPCEISFVKYASYVGTQSTETVKTLIGLNEEIAHRDVIVVEDIVDTGITMEQLLNDLQTFNPNSVRLACFSLKPEAFTKSFTIDYLGMEIPNDFIVGYGLDYNGYGRNLPEIYKLEN
jgi:hypoxanthine phosphoribosyltransferase